MKHHVIYKHVFSGIVLLLFLLIAGASYGPSRKDCDPLTTSVTKTFDVAIHVLDKATEEPINGVWVESFFSFNKFEKEKDNPCSGSLKETGFSREIKYTGPDGTVNFTSPSYTFKQATEYVYHSVEVRTNGYFRGPYRSLNFKSTSPSRNSLFMYVINKKDL